MAALVAGIFVASIGWSMAAVGETILGASAIFLVARRIKFVADHFPAQWWIVAMLVASFGIGAWYCHSYVVRSLASMRFPFNKEVSFTAVITSEPTESAKHETFTAEPWHSQELMVLAPPESGFRYGDFISMRGFIGAPDVQGEDPYIASPRITLIAHDRGFWLRSALINVREGMVRRLFAFLPQDEAALLGGELLGGSYGMSSETKSEMALSGTSYVLSMYGYKIATLTALVGIALGGLIHRRATFFICLTLVALFVLTAGLVASALRAGIMVALSLFAREVGRPLNMRNALMFTVAVMVMMRPTLLAGDTGFQLSLLSIMGITYLSGPIERWWAYQDAGFLSWKEGTVVTLAVLAPMVPLIARADGSFPVTALASNALLFLATPFTIFFGIVLVAASYVSAAAAYLVARVGEFILHYQIAIIKIFSIVVIPLPLPFSLTAVDVAYYAGIVIFIFYYDDERS